MDNENKYDSGCKKIIKKKMMASDSQKKLYDFMFTSGGDNNRSSFKSRPEDLFSVAFNCVNSQHDNNLLLNIFRRENIFTSFNLRCIIGPNVDIIPTATPAIDCLLLLGTGGEDVVGFYSDSVHGSVSAILIRVTRADSNM